MKTQTLNTRYQWKKPQVYKVLSGKMATVKDRPQSASGEPFQNANYSQKSQFPDLLNTISPHSLYGIKMMQIDDILSQRENFIGTIDFDIFYLHRRYITTSDKFIRIYHCQICAKNITPKASIILIHGFSQHLQYHLQTAIQFALNGYDCHLFDLRGFGYSTGPRCSNVVSNYQKDLHDVLLQVRKDKPCFLYAHSMGGLVAVTFIMKNPHIKIAGVILNAPLLQLHPKHAERLPQSKQKLVELFAKNANEFLFTVGLIPGVVSKNSWLMYKMLNDNRQIPITTAGQTVSWLSMFRSIKRGYKFENNNLFIRFKTPILICHGSEDMLCDLNSSIKFIKNIASYDKIIVPIKGAYHHLQMEPEASEILVLQSLKFMSRRLDKEDQTQNIGDPEPVYLGALRYPKENAVVKSLRYIGYSILLIIVAFLLYWQVRILLNDCLVSQNMGQDHQKFQCCQNLLQSSSILEKRSNDCSVLCSKSVLQYNFCMYQFLQELYFNSFILIIIRPSKLVN